MTVSIADVMQQMIAAGAPVDAVMIAVKAIEAVKNDLESQIEHNRATTRERVKKYRENKRLIDCNVTETLQKRDGNVTVTSRVSAHASSNPSSSLRSEGEERKKEKKTRESALSAPFEALLIESGVEPETLKAWKAVRAAKRAGPITAPVTAALARETAKAGISQQQAITICCERGWQGFKADWLNETRTHSPPRATAPPKRTLATMWLDDNEGFFTNGADSEIHGQGDTAGNPESDAWPLVIASTDSRRN